LIITAKQGQPVLPLPEGNTYLGFLFAYGEAVSPVEARLRRAHKLLEFEITETLPVVSESVKKVGGCAGLNRHVAGDERALRERRKRLHPDPESCRRRREAELEA
jgi:hypothetical protein